MGGAFRKFVGRTVALYAAAAVVVVLVVWALSQQGNWYERDAADRSRHYARNAEYQIANRCTLLTREDQTKCVKEAVQTARSDQREEQDLAAQKVTAWWTRAMGVAAIIGMALSAIGVFLVYVTFRASRDANATARKEFARARIDARKAETHSRLQAERTSEIADHSKETAERQLRPYVSIMPGPIEYTEVSEGRYVLTVRNMAFNGGATPAYSAFLLGEVSIGTPDGVAWKVKMSGELGKVMPGIKWVIAPRGSRPAEMEGQASEPVDDIIGAAQQNGTFIVMTGVCGYTDTFNQYRTTEICVYGTPMLTPEEIASGKISSDPHNIVWLTAPFGNDAT